MHRSLILASTFVVAASSSAFATVDFTLGTLAPGVYNLTGTTVGADNTFNTYTGANTAANWVEDVVYSFTTTVPLQFSMTSNDPNLGPTGPDNDFFLLSSMNASTAPNGTPLATDVILSQPAGSFSGVEVNGNWGLVAPGTYYLVIDAFAGGNPGGTATAYNVNLSLLLPPPPPTILLSGELDSGDGTFNRPNTGAPPTTLSTTGTSVFYEVNPFFVTADGTYSLEQGNSTFDDFMVLYGGSFDPLNPLANVIEADDDDGDGLNSLISRPLVAGVQYYLVNTSFGNNAVGTYDVIVTNPAGGTAVAGLIPEPATLGLLAGLAAFALRRR